MRIKGTKYTDYVNTMVNWTDELRKSVQTELSVGLQIPYCNYDSEENDESERTQFAETPLISYPRIEKPYRPIDFCHAQTSSATVKTTTIKLEIIIFTLFYLSSSLL